MYTTRNERVMIEIQLLMVLMFLLTHRFCVSVFRSFKSLGSRISPNPANGAYGTRYLPVLPYVRREIQT